MPGAAADRLAAAALRLVLRALPAAVRDTVEADLHESVGPAEGAARARHSLRLCREVLAIAWHYQAESHRTHESRLQLSALLAGCAALMFALPPALQTALRGWATVQPGPWTGGLAPALLMPVASAAAAGLLLGRLAPSAPHLAGIRRTVAALLVLIAFSLHPWWQALAGVAALAAGLWLGQVHRHREPDRPA